jgi:hypothetical protein
MLFDLYGDVILTRDVTERGLRAGDVGTVVERHAVPGLPRRATRSSSSNQPNVWFQLAKVRLTRTALVRRQPAAGTVSAASRMPPRRRTTCVDSRRHRWRWRAPTSAGSSTA